MNPGRRLSGSRRRVLARTGAVPDGGGGVARGVLRLGRMVRSVGRRPPDPVADRRVGRLVVVSIGAGAVHPGLTVVTAVLLAVRSVWRARQAEALRTARLLDSLPDVVDLLGLAAAAGATPRGAVDAVARHGHGPVAETFAAVLREVDDRGARLADRLARVPDDLDPALGSVVHPLVAAERYGTPLGPPLALAGRDLRQLRRHRAEEAIRRVPVKLVFPLVCCTLPAFGILTVVPLLAASLRHLEL